MELNKREIKILSECLGFAIEKFSDFNNYENEFNQRIIEMELLDLNDRFFDELENLLED